MATVCPEACAGAHADLPVELFEEAECFGCAEVAECVRVTLQHDPRPIAHCNVDADGFIAFIEEQTSRTAAWSGGVGCRWFGWVASNKLHTSVGCDVARFKWPVRGFRPRRGARVGMYVGQEVRGPNWRATCGICSNEIFWYGGS